MKRTVRRGDIYYLKLDPHIGSEQAGTRPVLFLSNVTGNRFSPNQTGKGVSFQTRPHACNRAGRKDTDSRFFPIYL